MKHIKYIFFDLDHTLWDFDKCSQETLLELFETFHADIGTHHSFDNFLQIYRHNNESLWRAYERNEINTAGIRKKRWELTFGEMKVEMGAWSQEMAEAYIHKCPRKPHLIPDAREVLDYLQPKYDVHMITNGWWDNQLTKLTHSGIKDYFGRIITSDRAESKKPFPEIFDYALEHTKAEKEACVYIGDSYSADVVGGMNAGWDVIYFNPKGKDNPHKAPEISGLNELFDIF